MSKHSEVCVGLMTDEDKNVIDPFKKGADLKEGVSGQMSIDTMFENTGVDDVQSPRSGDEAPKPIFRY